MVKIGMIADVHNGDSGPGEPDRRIWGEYDQRWYSNAPARMAVFATKIESESVDFGVQLGDLVDARSIAPDTELTEMVTKLTDDYTGEFFNVIGNHESFIWETVAGDWTAYNAAINNTETNDVHDCSLSTASTPACYSFDRKGIHFVVFCTECASVNRAAMHTWLEENLAAANSPIVIFAHSWLSCGREDGPYKGPISESDIATTRAILEAHDVQAVFSGHVHPVNDTPPGYLEYPNKLVVNKIPYYHLRGNLIGKSDESTPVTILNGDAAFYIIEIIPSAVQGVSRMLANIKVECYWNRNDSDKEYDKYLVM